MQVVSIGKGDGLCISIYYRHYQQKSICNRNIQFLSKKITFSLVSSLANLTHWGAKWVRDGMEVQLRVISSACISKGNESRENWDLFLPPLLLPKPPAPSGLLLMPPHRQPRTPSPSSSQHKCLTIHTLMPCTCSTPAPSCNTPFWVSFSLPGALLLC